MGNEEYLQKGLGIPGPEVAAKSKLDPSAFFGMIDRVVTRHPQIKIVATTMREVFSTNRHSWGAVAWINGRTYTAPNCDLDVYDRVGGGDGLQPGETGGVGGLGPGAALAHHGEIGPDERLGGGGARCRNADQP